MLKTRLFFIISIFLSVLCSNNAQSQDWKQEAIEYERIIFEDSGENINACLFGKAECLKQDGQYAEALATLSRVRSYLLSEDEVQELLYQQELCAFLSNNFSEAASYISMLNRWDKTTVSLHSLVLAANGQFRESLEMASLIDGIDPEGIERLKAEIPKEKDSQSAMIMSFLPPLGHLYTGNTNEGVLSMSMNLLCAGWMVSQIVTGNYIGGFLGGSIGLSYTYMGNFERTDFLVQKYNNNSRAEFCGKLQKLING